MDYQSVRHCSKTARRSQGHVRGWITSQFDTAPKRAEPPAGHAFVGLPVSSTLLQNAIGSWESGETVGLPVSSTLLQNPRDAAIRAGAVGLPVSSTLLQNVHAFNLVIAEVGLPVSSTLLQNVPTSTFLRVRVGLPVSSTLLQNRQSKGQAAVPLDYQSVRHCSKT